MQFLAPVSFFILALALAGCCTALGDSQRELPWRTEQLGSSVEGRAIEAWVAGQGPDVTIILASIHGSEGAGTPLLRELKAEGKRIAAYGAPAKGNTLLNFCGIGTDMIDFVADANPHKQGLYLPGSRIPVRAPSYIATARPDYLLILPWNLTNEIVAANAQIRDWGGRFVVPIPETRVIE